MHTPHLTSLSPAPTIGLVIETDTNTVAWALIRSTASDVTVEYGVESGRASLPLRQRLTLAAIDQAMELATTEQQIVDLIIYHPSTRNELSSQGTLFGLVHVAQRESIDFHHDTHQTIRQTLLNTISAVSIPVTPRRLITAASDGGYHAQYGGGGYGWIRDDGVYGYGAARGVSSALEAELHALLNLVKHAPARSTLLIHVDSRSAIDVVNFEGQTSRGADISGKAQTLVERILWFKEHKTPFTLHWVKGHNGHPLNDAADRLARLSRQSTDFGTPRDAVRAIAQGIADDVRDVGHLALAS